jgi:hypothetical protein
LEVLKATGVGSGGDVEGYIFVIGLAGEDYDPDDSGQFAISAFCYAA